MGETVELRVRELLERFGGADGSLGELLCDRHPADGVAFRVVTDELDVTTLTYGELSERSRRFAAGLVERGVRPGDRVATLMGKSAELVCALVGIWRLGAVHVPLFTAFAPPAIQLRLQASGAKVVIADDGQQDKLAGFEHHVLSPSELASHATAPDAPARGDAALIEIFTSGTTGAPKGVVQPLRALAGFCAYLEFGLDVRADDVYWNAADPGWAYGLYYGIVAPLAAGRSNILLSAGFSAPLTWRVLRELGVTNFAAAPTVYRALLREPAEPVKLRCLSSAGEPLTPDVVEWAERTFGVPVRDHYGQTEHGMVIANAWHPDLVRPVSRGSMGQVLPGWSASVLAHDCDAVAAAGEVGRLALDTHHSPLMTFRGYSGPAALSAERFSADGRWYLTGDVASVDEDGSFRFAARDDDVILMAGYRIGPFEVESVLVSHPAVAEAAAIGVPDDLRGEVLEAYVALADANTAGDELAAELQQWVKTNYAAHAYPRTVHFVDELPKTPSGKVQRYVLREQRRAALAGAT